MTDRAFNRLVFRIAAISDGLLGALFFFAPSWTFRQLGVAEPGHPAYIQFPGALLMIFAAMFAKIAHEPAQYRHLIPYGIALKAAYCSLALWYGINPGIPNLWKACALFDLVMGILFIHAYRSDA
jgi:hypothetical protein